MKTMNIFFDLEETLIKDWFDPAVLHGNLSFIHKQIKLLENKFQLPVKLHIFSFAIIDEADLEQFNQLERPWITNTFGELHNVFIANDENLFQLAKLKGITPVSGDKPSDLFGNMKSEAFEQFVKRDFKNSVNVLFDDMVENTSKTFFHKELFDEENSTTIIEIKV